MNRKDWREVPLPTRMGSLPKDPRGLPVPYVVFRDEAGVAKFNVNDTLKSIECLFNRLCPICGQPLDREVWLVGGPLSAFHEDGVYNDTPMHHDCMEYALQVCPYLAAPSYSGSIGGKNLTEFQGLLLVDFTMLPGRPEVFVAVGCVDQVVVQMGPFTYRVRPVDPFGYEFWVGGEKIDQVKGMDLASASMAKSLQAELQSPKIVVAGQKKAGGS